MDVAEGIACADRHHTPYDPSQVSEKFVASLTIASLLGGGASDPTTHPSSSSDISIGNGLKKSSADTGRRIASETPHEERLRRMMQRMCRDIRETHFPGSAAAESAAAAATVAAKVAADAEAEEERRRGIASRSLESRASTRQRRRVRISEGGINTQVSAAAGTPSPAGAPLHLPSSLKSPPSTAPAQLSPSAAAATTGNYSTNAAVTTQQQQRRVPYEDDDEQNMSKYAREWAAERRAKRAADDEAAEARVAAAGAGPLRPTLYPSYHSGVLTSEWTEAVLGDPAMYTELLARQQRTALQLSNERNAGVLASSATLAGAVPVVPLLRRQRAEAAAQAEAERAEAMAFVRSTAVGSSGVTPPRLAGVGNSSAAAASSTRRPLALARCASAAAAASSAECEEAIDAALAGLPDFARHSDDDGDEAFTLPLRVGGASVGGANNITASSSTASALGGVGAAGGAGPSAVVPAMAIEAHHLPSTMRQRYVDEQSFHGRRREALGVTAVGRRAEGGGKSTQLNESHHSAAEGNNDDNSLAQNVASSDFGRPIHRGTAPLLVANRLLPPISPFTTVLGKHTMGRRFVPVCAADQRDHRTHQYTKEELEAFELGHRKMPDGPIVSDWRRPSDTSIAVLDARRKAALTGGIGGSDNGGSAQPPLSYSYSQPLSLCDVLRAELAELEETDRRETEQAKAAAAEAAAAAASLAAKEAKVAALEARVTLSRSTVEVAAMQVELLSVREWEKEAAVRLSNSRRGGRGGNASSISPSSSDHHPLNTQHQQYQQLPLDRFYDLSTPEVAASLPLESPLIAARELVVRSPNERTRAEARRRERELIEGALVLSTERLRRQEEEVG